MPKRHSYLIWIGEKIFRERVENLTDREKLLNEVREKGGYNPDFEKGHPDFVRSISAPSGGLKPASERVLAPPPTREISPREALMQSIQKAGSVSENHIHDGKSKSSDIPEPPKSPPKFRNVQQKPKTVVRILKKR